MFSQLPMIREMLDEARDEARDEAHLKIGQKYILETLADRFGQVPLQLERRISAIEDTERIDALHRNARTCSDLKDFTRDFGRQENVQPTADDSGDAG